MKNRTSNGKRFGIASLTAVLAALLLFTACTPAPTAEEENVVEIAMIGAFTGAAASASQYALTNMSNYIRYFNDEIGIPQVTIKLAWADSAFEVPRAISVYNRLVERGIVGLCIVNPTEAAALKPKCEGDEVPAIVLGITASLMYPPGWIYAIYPTEVERFSVWCNWVMENWQEERPPRVALIGTDTEWGRQLEGQGIRYAESIGIVMLPTEVVAYLPLDVTTQMLRLREGGADFAYVTSTWTTAVPIVKDAQRLGLIGKMRFAGYENSQSISLLQVLGDDVEGYSSPRVAPWIEEVEVPGIKLLRDLQMEYQGGLDIQGDEAHQLRAAYILCEAVKRAIEEVGYENINGSAVNRALLTMKDFDPYGIGPVTYTPEDHRGSNLVRIYRVKSGEVVPITDWREAPMIVPEG